MKYMAFLLLFGFSTLLDASITGANSTCNKESDRYAADMCLAFIAGMATMNTMTQYKGTSQVNWCTNGDVTFGELTEKYEKFISTKPEIWRFPEEIIITTFFQELYPCQ